MFFVDDVAVKLIQDCCCYCCCVSIVLGGVAATVIQCQMALLCLQIHIGHELLFSAPRASAFPGTFVPVCVVNFVTV